MNDHMNPTQHDIKPFGQVHTPPNLEKIKSSLCQYRFYLTIADVIFLGYATVNFACDFEKFSASISLFIGLFTLWVLYLTHREITRYSKQIQVDEKYHQSAIKEYLEKYDSPGLTEVNKKILDDSNNGQEHSTSFSKK